MNCLLIFHSKLPKIHKFWPLKRENFQFVFIFNDNNVNILNVWGFFGHNKQFNDARRNLHSFKAEMFTAGVTLML